MVRENRAPAECLGGSRAGFEGCGRQGDPTMGRAFGNPLTNNEQNIRITMQAGSKSGVALEGEIVASRRVVTGGDGRRLVLYLFFLSVFLGIQSVPIVSAQVPDLTPERILSPPDVVKAESTYTPSVMIQNVGNDSAIACSVVCAIDSWSDTVTGLTIPDSDSLSVDFAAWTVPDSGVYLGSYVVTVFTLCANDTSSSNDTLSKTVYIRSDTLIIVSETGFTGQSARISLLLVNPYHRLGGVTVGTYLTKPSVAGFDSADYSTSAISHWEWLQSNSPSPTTLYLDAIAENGSPPATPPLDTSSQRRLLAELVVDIDSNAPGIILPYNWSESSNDPGIRRWMRHESNPRTGDACASVAAEPIWRNDDWLITPKLSVTSGDSLKFWYRVDDANFPESLEVRLSTNGVHMDSFTTVLWAASLANTNYLERKEDLSAYDGLDAYIAFVYRSQSKKRLYIDDVSGCGLSQGFEAASTLIGFSVSSFLVDSTGYRLYLPIMVPGVLYVEGPLCGDCNGDGRITVADASYIVSYIYRAGPPPVGEADVNVDGRITVADASYIVSYIYRDGPEPCNPSPHLILRRSQRNRTD